MASRQKDILIAVVGLTPQVVTETLWALYHRSPPVMIKEVWVLTTLAGRERCLKDLLTPDASKFHSFCRDYKINKDGIKFGSPNIVVLNGANGEPLEDIRTSAESGLVANQVSEFVRKQAARPDVRLHCSAAGGRKTMGIFLAFALQLYGREEDRLYHVLVNEPFETHPDFFYKPRKDTVIKGRDGKLLHTRKAVIELTEIPYVRLREYIPKEILFTQRSFTDLVRLAQHELTAIHSPEPAILDLKKSCLQIGSTSLSFSRSQMILYAFFVRRKTRHCIRQNLRICDGCTECYPKITKTSWPLIVEEIKSDIPIATKRGISIPKEVEQFRTAISKVNRVITNGLNSERIAYPYLIHPVGKRWDKRYGIAIDKGKIICAM